MDVGKDTFASYAGDLRNLYLLIVLQLLDVLL